MTVHRLSVRVPATSANLGPGFDCMGLALELFNEFSLELERPFGVTVSGEWDERLPIGEQNVVVQAMVRLFAEAGVALDDLPAFALHLDNQIPISSGLGSSASAIVGGLLLANALLSTYRPNAALSQQEVLALAVAIEGHPDNVAPALLGGGTLVFHDKAGPRTVSFPIPDALCFVAATPDFALSTEEARKVLPAVYERAQVVENVAQCARLMLALTMADLDLLRGGLTDHLHEPYRLPLVPGAKDVVRAAVETGAFAVTLSGAGPTLLAWCRQDHAVQIADEMTLAWRNAGTPCRSLVLSPCKEPTSVCVHHAIS
ncbi:homoserine kinase [Alicyclobacillus fodiniaquatilis]|jgi:homoserine kinase|uniref:Homoserine kinase n=1 Tax=Alicyclobacillus fodiniaquatilis TaxID=1661150 RepID=A0ABW4JNX8_9BACL